MEVVRPAWRKIFRFSRSFGILLILLLGIPRFIIVLRANVTGDYTLVPLMFIFMSITPVIFRQSCICLDRLGSFWYRLYFWYLEISFRSCSDVDVLYVRGG